VSNPIAALTLCLPLAMASAAAQARMVSVSIRANCQKNTGVLTTGTNQKPSR
jgi:hypothetical protein